MPRWHDEQKYCSDTNKEYSRDNLYPKKENGKIASTRQVT